MEMENEKIDEKRSVGKQYELGLLANFSSIAPSMSLGFSAIALPILKETLTTTQLSWFASIASLATPFGCFLTGPFADKFGRRKAMILVNLVSLLGWITIALYCRYNLYWMLIVGRVFTGLSTGLCSSPATVYMAEISTPDLRSIFTTWASVTFSLGVLIIYFFGFLFKNNLEMICLITCCFPCVGLIFTTFFIPESPSWLIARNKIDSASKSLSIIYKVDVNSRLIRNEIDSLSNYNNNQTIYKETLIGKFIYLVNRSECLRPIGLVLIFFMFQQFSGIFVIIFYAIDIIKNAGITFDPYLSIVVIGIVRLFSAILPSFLAKRYGKRPLSIFSGTGMTICLLLLSLVILLSVKMQFIPLLLLLFYFVTSSVGFLPFPFALSAELFPSKVRGTAAGFTSGIGYFFNFVAVKIYPDMVVYFGRSGTFCFYGVVALVGTIFVCVFLPETKGKTLMEIQEYFGKNDGNKESRPLKHVV